MCLPFASDLIINFKLTPLAVVMVASGIYPSASYSSALADIFPVDTEHSNADNRHYERDVAQADPDRLDYD